MNDTGGGVSPGRKAGLWRAALGAGVILLGLRTFYLFVEHLRGEILRPRVESSAVIFVVAGMALALSSTTIGREGSRVRRTSAALPSPALWLIFLVVTFALYWPALNVGLLSDDWILWNRAAAWKIGPVTTELVRPLPLLIWAILINAGASPVALHVLNIVVHGTNGYLTARLCDGWIGGGRAAMLAGGLMIALPLAVEPVSWVSGLFDLSVTALVLLLVLRGRSYERSVTPASRALFIAIGVLTMTAKETGAIAVLLVLIDTWIRRSGNRRLLIDAGVVLVIAAVFSAVRIVTAFGMTTPSVSRYRLQRTLFETFGGLAVPFHTDVVQLLPWIPVIAVFIVIALVVSYCVVAGRRSDRFVVGGTAWVLVSISPMVMFVFVAPDLQGARYLYLAGPAWTSLVAGFALSADRTITRRTMVSAAIALVALWAIAVRVHVAAWTDAARTRDQVIRAARSDARMQDCRTVAVTNLPDVVRGAYVFRNGSPEAFERDARLRLSDDAGAKCRFEWTGHEFRPGVSRAPE